MKVRLRNWILLIGTLIVVYFVVSQGSDTETAIGTVIICSLFGGGVLSFKPFYLLSKNVFNPYAKFEYTLLNILDIGMYPSLAFISFFSMGGIGGLLICFYPFMYFSGRVFGWMHDKIDAFFRKTL